MYTHVCTHTRVGRNRKKFKLHASQTASESSTIAEEIVVLLRRLHPLPAWNPLINQYISRSLQTIPKLITLTTGDTSSLSRREQQVHINYVNVVCMKCHTLVKKIVIFVKINDKFRLKIASLGFVHISLLITCHLLVVY